VFLDAAYPAHLDELIVSDPPVCEVAGAPEDGVDVETERRVGEAVDLAVDRELVVEADPRHI
jgi:hypothetical protein